MDKTVNLFSEAKKSKVLFNAAISLIILVLMMVAASILGNVILSLIFNSMGFYHEVIMLSFSTAMLIGICFLWVKFVEKRKIYTLGLQRKGAIFKFLNGFLFGFLMFAAVTLFMYLTGNATLEENISSRINLLPQILFISIGWIIQGSSEEILTRGWFMHVVGARHTPMIGFILSSTIFGFIHLFNPGVSFMAVFNIILVGFMLGLYVIHTQNLWGACGLHAAWNFTQANVFGFKVSGLSLETGALMVFETDGPEIFTGGAFGPEASVFSTIVQLAVIVILVVKLIKSRDKQEQ